MSVFRDEYDKVVNKFTLEFAKEYCDAGGAILWEKLVQFNSGKKSSVGHGANQVK